MIKATSLTFNYGLKPIFDQVSFTINKNHQIGLVGPNGSGKTTLLKLILGKEQIDSGRLNVTGSIGYDPQEVTRDPDLEISSTIRHSLDPSHQHPDYQLQSMLSGVEMSDFHLTRNPGQFSGGQKTKLALIRALLSQPDILLLDEPTNFMDTAGKQWVINFLSTYPKTLVIISHDLKLLDHSIDKVLYLNIQTHKIDEYTGNYIHFNFSLTHPQSLCHQLPELSSLLPKSIVLSIPFCLAGAAGALVSFCAGVAGNCSLTGFAPFSSPSASNFNFPLLVSDI